MFDQNDQFPNKLDIEPFRKVSSKKLTTNDFEKLEDAKFGCSENCRLFNNNIHSKSCNLYVKPLNKKIYYYYTIIVISFIIAMLMIFHFLNSDRKTSSSQTKPKHQPEKNTITIDSAFYSNPKSPKIGNDVHQDKVESDKKLLNFWEPDSDSSKIYTKI